MDYRFESMNFQCELSKKKKKKVTYKGLLCQIFVLKTVYQRQKENLLRTYLVLGVLRRKTASIFHDIKFIRLLVLLRGKQINNIEI